MIRPSSRMPGPARCHGLLRSRPGITRVEPCAVRRSTPDSGSVTSSPTRGERLARPIGSWDRPRGETALGGPPSRPSRAQRTVPSRSTPGRYVSLVATRPVDRPSRHPASAAALAPCTRPSDRVRASPRSSGPGHGRRSERLRCRSTARTPTITHICGDLAGCPTLEQERPAGPDPLLVVEGDEERVVSVRNSDVESTGALGRCGCTCLSGRRCRAPAASTARRAERRPVSQLATARQWPMASLGRASRMPATTVTRRRTSWRPETESASGWCWEPASRTARARTRQGRARGRGCRVRMLPGGRSCQSPRNDLRSFRADLPDEGVLVIRGDGAPADDLPVVVDREGLAVAFAGRPQGDDQAVRSQRNGLADRSSQPTTWPHSLMSDGVRSPVRRASRGRSSRRPARGRRAGRRRRCRWSQRPDLGR